ncbi:amino acid permease [Streptomyces salinarius]|uniref:Amino acid permease n=1 Tax=Streptomyces salinarius TaxID=2762598 RepID=A0ABW8BBF1_9ACTN
MPGIVYLAVAPLTEYVLGIDDASPRMTLFIALLMLTVAYLVNIISVQVAARINNVAVLAEILGSVVVSVVLGMLVLIGFTVAIPSDEVLAAGGLPAVFQYWLGEGLARTFVGVVVFAMFTLMVVSAAVIARLLFAMARDNMLPGSALLRQVNPTTRTPVPALLAGYVLNIAVVVFGYNSSNAFGTLVGATAVLPYLVYLLIVLAYGYRRRRLAAVDGAFDLGRFAGAVFGTSLVYLVAVVLTLTLPDEFRRANYYVLGGLVLAALWWLVGLRPRLARGAAGAPLLDQPHPHTDGPKAQEVGG